MISSQLDSTISQSMRNEAVGQCEQLVIAAQAGSHAAFGELQEMFSHRLYRRIMSILRNHEDAEDALQDTFLRAYVALPSFQGRSQFSTWLTRIATNSALMKMRRNRSRPDMLFDQQQQFDEDLIAFDIRDNALNPERLCGQEQEVRAILNAVERLDPKLRTPIHNLIEEECTMKELAHHLRTSVSSVKSRIHRARKRLRERAASRKKVRGELVSKFGLREERALQAGSLRS